MSRENKVKSSDLLDDNAVAMQKLFGEEAVNGGPLPTSTEKNVSNIRPVRAYSSPFDDETTIGTFDANEQKLDTSNNAHGQAQVPPPYQQAQAPRPQAPMPQAQVPPSQNMQNPIEGQEIPQGSFFTGGNLSRASQAMDGRTFNPYGQMNIPNPQTQPSPMNVDPSQMPNGNMQQGAMPSQMPEGEQAGSMPQQYPPYQQYAGNQTPYQTGQGMMPQQMNPQMQGGYPQGQSMQGYPQPTITPQGMNNQAPMGYQPQVAPPYQPEQMPQQGYPMQQGQYQQGMQGYGQQMQQGAYYGQQGVAPAWQMDRLPQPEASLKTYNRKMISGYSPKGGAGKSSIVKELGFLYSNTKVNGQNLRVLLVDCDWEYPDLSTLLGVKTTGNIASWARQMFTDKRQFGSIPYYEKGMIERQYIKPITNNLFLLPGSQDPTASRFIDSAVVDAIIDNLARCDFDVILFDNANSIADSTKQVLKRSDTVLLIETVDATTINETRTFLNTLRGGQFDTKKIKMVINKLPAENNMDMAIDEIVAAIGLDYITAIPNDDSIRVQSNDAKSVVLETQPKDTPMTKEIKKVANALFPIFKEEKESFFKRLFKRR